MEQWNMFIIDDLGRVANKEGWILPEDTGSGSITLDGITSNVTTASKVTIGVEGVINTLKGNLFDGYFKEIPTGTMTLSTISIGEKYKLIINATIQNNNSKSSALSFYLSNGSTEVALPGTFNFVFNKASLTDPRSKICLVEANDYVGVVLANSWENDYHEKGTYYSVAFVKEETLSAWGDFIYKEESDIYGEASSEEGYSGGGFDSSSDVISVPDDPDVGITSCGFINVYKTTQSGLQNLGDDLFPDFVIPEFPTPTASGIAEAIEKICEAMNSIGSMAVTIGHQFVNDKLINYVIDCHVIPVAPVLGSEESIKIGFKTMSQTGTRVTTDYVNFDCGSLSLSEYYHNFIDYAGTRAKLFLPFVGFVDIKPEYFQGGTLSVKYKFNVVDGSFMAYVISTSSKSALQNSVIGAYGGNACVHIPITGTNYANMVSTLVAGAGSIAGGAVAGNVGSVMSGAANVMSAKPEVQASNDYNATTSFLGVRYPYLIIEREVADFPRNYESEIGFPLNVTKTLKDCHGFTIASSLHLDGITCTDTEKNMIEQALKSGVILP